MPGPAERRTVCPSGPSLPQSSSKRGRCGAGTQGSRLPQPGRRIMYKRAIVMMAAASVLIATAVPMASAVELGSELGISPLACWASADPATGEELFRMLQTDASLIVSPDLRWARLDGAIDVR